MRHKTQVSWTTSEIRILQRLAKVNGMSAGLISKSHLIPRHTQAGISQMMSELSFGNLKHVARAKSAIRLGKQRRDELIQFLKTQGRLMPASDVAGKFKIRSEMVRYYRRKLGVRLPGKLRFTSKAYQDSRKTAVLAMQKALREYHDSFWEKRREALYRLLQKDALHNCINGFVKCKSCGESWPRNGRYFYFGRVHDGVRTILPYCRGCGPRLWPTKARKTRKEHS